MSQSELDPSTELRRLTNGYQVSQAIHVAATLGIANLLRDSPRTCDELALATDTHEPSLYRLLRALASVGVFREEGDHRFALTPIGACLCSDAAEPGDGWAAFIGQPCHWQAWGHLLHSVRTGENAFRHVHGMDSWTYREQHPELSAAFDRAMTTNTRRMNLSLLSAYDFSQFGTIVDVGGGRGALMTAILGKHPTVQGVLFDQPHVVAGATQVFLDAGITSRCQIVGGDFFTEVPAGGDAYLLKFILHDWEDEEATAILRSCRQAIPRHGKLLVIEREVGAPNTDWDPKFTDLLMLVGPGGRERTLAEYVALFAAAGFQLVAAIPAGEVNLFEGIPV